jgi:predicted nucleic acid-binding protein
MAEPQRQPLARCSLEVTERLVEILGRRALVAPTVVVAEWWRGRTDSRDAILRAVTVEPLDGELAKSAGEAMAAVRGSTLADAIVMASAARAGGVVLTSDFDDLDRLRAYFPTVRVLEV